MSRKAVLSVAVPIFEQSNLYEKSLSHSDKEKQYFEIENLHIFSDHIAQLKEEVNRLSFMMSEIRTVLVTSSSAKHLLAEA